MALGHSPRIVRDGLVLYLDAANIKSYPGSGTTWFDLSGNGYNGVIANGPVFQNTFLGAINCDPVNDLVYINNTFNFIDYITIDLVYRRDSADGVSDRIIYNKESSWELRDLDGNLSWALMATNVSWFWLDTGYDVAIGETLNVILTYDGNFVKTFVNGNLINTYTYPAGGTLAKPISYPKLNSRGGDLSSWSNGGDHTFFNFKVYNRALSDVEIKQNFNALRGRYGI
jgi:hypothetical protein